MKHREDAEVTTVGIDRRDFIGRTVTASLPLLCSVHHPAGGEAQEPKTAAISLQGQEHLGLIVRKEKPENLEFPFSTLDSFITPNERFYVRNHFPMPRPDVKSWRLRVEGAVKRPLELTYE